MMTPRFEHEQPIRMSAPELTREMFERFREELRSRHGIDLSEECLGNGGAARVYTATDSQNPGGVDLIVVRFRARDRARSHYANDRNALYTLLRQCRDSFLLPGRALAVSDAAWHVSCWERCDKSWKEALEQSTEGRFDTTECLRHIRNIATGLDHLLGKAVLHCDVSPANILLRDGVAVLSDFDLLIERNDDSTAKLEPLGTRGFRAPDFDSPHIYSADLFSLAACYLWARTGRDPFEAVAGVPDTKRPVFDGLGQAETEVVRVALAEEHERRLAYGRGKDLHIAWVAALEQAVEDDGNHVVRTRSRASAPYIRVGLHGVRNAGKTTLLSMLLHGNAGKTQTELEFPGGLSIEAAPDEDGTSTSTLIYCVRSLEQIEKYGKVQQTQIDAKQELRFEVCVGRKRAVAVVEDYGGEAGELEASVDAVHEQTVKERLQAIANCDVQILLLPCGRDDAAEALNALRLLRGYLDRRAEAFPDRPRPVVFIVYSKADRIENLDLDDRSDVARWLDDRRGSTSIEGDEASTGIGWEQVLRLLPTSTVEPMPVSAFGAEPTGEPGQALHPKLLWQLMGRVVEHALRNFETWANSKLAAVERALDAGNLVAAADAIDKECAGLADYVDRYPGVGDKLDRFRATLLERQRAQAKIERAKSHRRIAVAAVAATLLGIASFFAYDSYRTRTETLQFDSAVAAIDRIGPVEERWVQRRAVLSKSWTRVPVTRIESLRKADAADTALVEDLHLEIARRWRATQNADMHATARLKYTEGIATRGLRHIALYDAWDREDAAADLRFREARATDRILAIPAAYAKRVVEAVAEHRRNFVSYSKPAEIEQKLRAARLTIRENEAVAALEAALTRSKGGATLTRVVAALRHAATLAIGTKHQEKVALQLRLHVDRLDRVDYSRLHRESAALVANGDATTPKALRDYVAACQAYVGAPRSIKRMTDAVRASSEAAQKMVTEKSLVRLELSSIKVPYYSYFWTYWGNNRSAGETTLRVSARGSSVDRRLAIQSTGTWKSDVSPITLQAKWGDLIEVELFRYGTKKQGRQYTYLPVASDWSGSRKLSLAKRNIWKPIAREPATIKVRVHAKSFDMKRLSLPSYEDGR